MLSGLLRSKRAVLVNIAIMRTFVKLRKILYSHKEIAKKLAKLIHITGKHEEDIQLIFKAIQQMMDIECPHKGEFGFKPDQK